MRIFSLMVSLLLVSTGLVACGDDTDDSANSTVPATDTAPSASDAGVTDAVEPQTDGQPWSDAASPGDVAEDVGPTLTLETGPDDEYAQAGCELLNGEKTAVIAGSSASEAGQQVLLPNGNTGWAVALPESGVGFVTLEVPDWQVVIALYTTAGVEIVIHDPDEKTEPVLALSWAAPCAEQEITEERTKYHKWGGFTLELRGEPGGEVWLAAIDLPVE
jgi:hypothetical protein